MDTTDEEIRFDANGVCNHCSGFDELKDKTWFPNEFGAKHLERLLADVKREGAGKEFDCIIGLSGGLDSSYLAIKLKEWGIRPLAVHVDAGWNSEFAVANIEKIVTYCGFDLLTHVIDWEAMRNLQLAYLKSGVPNQDVPQDHIFFSTLYHFATKNKIRTVMNGGNTASEGIFPDSWHASAMDALNLMAIYKTFGESPLKNYSTISFSQYYLWYPFVKRMRTLRPLNFIDYRLKDAAVELEAKTGWKPYRRKHGESIFTKLFQNYILPLRYGYDKRKPHLSSLICSEQITREDALNTLREPLYEVDELAQDIAYFCKKLRISREQFEGHMQAPKRRHSDFRNWNNYYVRLKKSQRLFQRLTGKQMNAYS